MRPGKSTQYFFNTLQKDMLSEILKRLNVYGPAVELLEGTPSKEQEESVLAANGPTLEWSDDKPNYSNNETKKPDLSIYHLIVDDDISGISKKNYSIGFCKRSEGGTLTYETKVLDPKSPLLRYVTENPSVLDKKRFQDRNLLKYMEQEIKAAGGLVGQRLRDRTHFAAICPDTNAVLNGSANWLEQQLFARAIKQEMLDDLLHHVAYGEQDKAREILNIDPSLLLLTGKNISDCSPERTIKATTAFQLAVWNSDWPMWEMMLDVINHPKRSEKQCQRNKLDLQQRLYDLSENRLEYTIDNLLNKGVRILDANTLAHNREEAIRMKKDVVDRNAYHLIVTTELIDGKSVVKSCVLGFRDPTSQQYTQYEVPQNNRLFAIANELYQELQNVEDDDGNELQHFVTRREYDLDLVKEVLKELKVETELLKKSSEFDLKPLLSEIVDRIQNDNGWSSKRSVEHWHVNISTLLRELPDFPRRLLEETEWLSKNDISNSVKSPGRVDLVKNIYDEVLYPVSRSLGDKFCTTWGGSGSSGASLRVVVESILLEFGHNTCLI